MILRRALAVAVGAAVALPAAAQPVRRKPLVAGVYVASEAAVRPYHEAFVDGLRDLGLVPGRDLVVQARHADGDAARLPALVDEAIALEPDLLFGLEAVAVVMQRRTTTIPIVLTSSADLVAAGLVQSLRRPGTNVTGMATLQAELLAKQIELLTEVVPGLARVGLLNAGSGPVAARYVASAREAAAAKRIALVVAAADDAMGLDQAFGALMRGKPQALAVASSGAMQQMRQEVAAHARRLRLPSISALPAETWVGAGGLIAYSPDVVESFRKAAGYVERILRGASPAGLPVEQASRFQFWINLETARAIGLAIPKSILLRADKVIE